MIDKLEFKKGGVYDIRYARFENCGMKDIMGRYCSHFHYSSTCPNCKLIGNAYENAIQSAVTVHETHHSLVDNNVMWNARQGSSNRSLYCEQTNDSRSLVYSMFDDFYIERRAYISKMEMK